MGRRVKVIAATVVILVVLLSVVPATEDAARPLAATEREKNVGATATLMHGVTRYEASGLFSGPAVVLIHGVSGPMKVWDRLIPPLTEAGYRVLRYDLFGRGLSDRVTGPYDEQLFDEQLRELVEKVGITTPFTVVGSSMGAIVATGFANRHPTQVRAVVLIGPAGFPIEASPAAKLLDVPILGPAMMAMLGGKLLPEHHRKYFVHPEKVPELHAAFADQLQIAGTKRAIRETMATMPVNNFRSGYDTLGKSGIPVQLLWGTGDVTFPFAYHAEAQRLIPQAQFTAIENAAHLPQYEAANATEAALLPFLKSLAR